MNNMYQNYQNMGYMGSNNCCGPKDTCQVINKCFVEEVPHYYNCHTHVVNTCVRKHIYIPKYSCSEETVYVDQC